MLEIIDDAAFGASIIRLKGRIDGLTAPELTRHLDACIIEGARVLILDLTEVHYLSSAGLRSFLLAEKRLAALGGRVILHRPGPTVIQVLKMSGFDTLFELSNSPEELAHLMEPVGQLGPARSLEVAGLVLKIIEHPAPAGTLSTHGNPAKLSRADYRAEDVVAIPARNIRFGAGLGTFGPDFAGYKDYFGEALVVEHGLFFQPAAPRSGADFIFGADPASDLEYRFLHAFGFAGSFKYMFSFEDQAGLPGLDRLLAAALQVSSAPVLGLVLVAESKGLWGLSLKKVPWIENKPTQGRDIFDPSVFRDWMAYPVEPTDIGHILLGAGLVSRDPATADPAIRDLLAPGETAHVHGAVLGRGPVDRRPERFEAELTRVMTELEVLKVQHLLPATRLAGGLAGIVELEV